MRILGIDPGTQTMGYSVLDLDDGGGMPVCRVWGTLKGGASKDIADRLYLLLSGLREVIAAWEPGQLAIEEPFVSMNRGAKSAIAVGQAQAVALLAATEHGLTIHRYAPAQVKSAVTNYGGGTKGAGATLGEAAPWPRQRAYARGCLRRYRHRAVPCANGSRRRAGRPPMSIIAGIEGTIETKFADSAIVRVGGGIMLRVFIPTHDLSAMPDGGAAVRLHTHLVVREDDLQLYGFASEQGRRLFEMLIGVSQVGPKVALAVLSVMPPQEVAGAVVAGDAAALSRAQGVGRRTAERIILDLKGKLEEEMGAPVLPTGTAGTGTVGDPAVQWLIALGYSALEARQALAADPDVTAGTDDRVKRALQRMGGG